MCKVGWKNEEVVFAWNKIELEPLDKNTECNQDQNFMSFFDEFNPVSNST